MLPFSVDNEKWCSYSFFFDKTFALGNLVQVLWRVKMWSWFWKRVIAVSTKGNNFLSHWNMNGSEYERNGSAINRWMLSCSLNVFIRNLHVERNKIFFALKMSDMFDDVIFSNFIVIMNYWIFRWIKRKIWPDLLSRTFSWIKRLLYFG